MPSRGRVKTHMVPRMPWPSFRHRTAVENCKVRWKSAWILAPFSSCPGMDLFDFFESRALWRRRSPFFHQQFPLFPPSESRRSHADPTHSSPSAGTKSFDFCPDFSWDPDELPTSPCSLWEPQGLGLHAVGSPNIDPFSSHQPRNMNLAMAIGQALLETVSVPIKKWR